MPELPDLVYIVNHLSETLPGRTVTGVTIKEPIVLRPLVREPFDKALLNQNIATIYRRGPFIGVTFEDNLELVMHLMLAGKLKLSDRATEKGRGFCFALALDDGRRLLYLDDKRMGKIYLTAKGEYARIPRFVEQGIDITTPAFTLQKFRDLIARQRKQVRVFIMDQTQLSAIGNAYADEILFEAGIHPKTFCYQLADEEIDRLYRSIREVIDWGIAEVKGAGQPIEVKVRDHMRVRNRKDQPCPRCGARIRRAGVLGHDAFFCPDCQPQARPQFIDWRTKK